MSKNYYKTLKVSRNASDEVIKKAYTTLAKKHHLDLNKDKMEFSNKRGKAKIYGRML
ncbi:DnaJ domain-containing protein [Clostridium sp. MB40-C1]|uniref:DnaJ domain-containing protein n=1 Tax=Clostridium sp. MB40-C1 TaxID=3070996 RepID=UPI0027E0E407|nr:DnaJ domain-containing protein [Clostridium sp. MB40-C1]WMJ82253.1 DnaJ domain-containing protein [Clostridium sp. MB40-C1]